MQDQGGYTSSTANYNYVQKSASFLIDFGNVTYKTLSGGYDMFCYNLANQFVDVQ